MTGFDNGTAQGGVFFQTKQFGSILRGFGPPVPQAGVVGDLYVDTQTWFLYNKRGGATGDSIDPWGSYLFQVPVAYQAALKWFNSVPPGNDIGIPGDYCLLWSGFANYGMQPSLYGPKQLSGWPENGVGSDTSILNGAASSVGIADEGPDAAYSTSTQLVAVGLSEEYILAIPATPTVGSAVLQRGLQSQPLNVVANINPLYGAEDQHAV